MKTTKINSIYTDVTLLLDRSGSMSSMQAEVKGGIKSFIEDQKKLKGKCLLSICQFDDKYDVVLEGKDIQKCSDVPFEPRGMTALLDAIGKTIVSTKERFSKLKDKPTRVVLAIITDGQENASQEYKRDQIFKMISEQRDKHAWDILFLAANQDAIAVGADLGINAVHSMTYRNTEFGNRAMYKSLSTVVGAVHDGQAAMFSDEDRIKQK